MVALGGVASAGSKASGTHIAEAQAQAYIIPCELFAGFERQACQQTDQDFLRDYVGAMAGDYQSQVNVAYVLRARQNPYLKTSQIQACAWRLIVVASGHAEVTGDDTMMVNDVCGTLSAIDQTAARARASAIGHEIKLHPAEIPPEPILPPHKGQLDSTVVPFGAP